MGKVTFGALQVVGGTRFRFGGHLGQKIRLPPFWPRVEILGRVKMGKM